MVERIIHTVLSVVSFPRWRHLKFRDPIVFEMRGSSRAVAMLDQDEALEKFADRLQAK